MSLKVAVWGSYAYGNYGDELMALHYAQHLKKLGVHPVVYQLRDTLAKRYQIESAPTAEELVRDTAFCVFGGGSLLSGNKNPPDWYDQQKRGEYQALTTAIEKHECPLYFLSIGGDGDFGDGSGIADYRKRLLASKMCRSATIRQEPDVELIEKKFGINAVYYPDVLLNVKEFWDIEPNNTDKKRVHVGLNLPESYRWLAKLLTLFGRLRGDFVFHFINTVRPFDRKGNLGGELMPKNERWHVRKEEYDDPIDTLRLLASLDIIFSFKLHIGLTATAFGAPLICIKRKLKTKAFLHSIGADFAYWGDASPMSVKLRFLRTALSRKRIKNVQMRLKKESNLQQQVDESWRHFDRLTSFVQEYRPKEAR